VSFILDALKKSEKERQREAVPGFGDLPIVVHHARTSTWVVTLIAVLGLGVIALAWAWWRASNPGLVVASSSPVVPAATVEMTAPPAPAVVEPQPSARPETRSLANEATRIAAVTNGQSAALVAAEPLVVQAAPPVITPSPMSILQARASGMAVPELTLELLVYSPVPAQRFVYINSTKYVEGETLTDGPRVIEISTEGAILSYRGQNFLLPQE